MSEILAVLFSVVIGIMFTPKIVQLKQDAHNNNIAAITAQQWQQLFNAGNTYIQQNASTIQSVATASTPAVITVPMLLATNSGLPTNFSATNPYGQTWQIEVLQPSAGNLQAIAMSYGGTSLTDLQAARVAGMLGAAGGIIPKNDSGTYAGGSANAYGTFSGWTISTANYTNVSGGHLAALFTFNSGQLTSNYLYRNSVAGQPQLNTMNTPLIMGVGTIQTVSTACATNGAIGRDNNGKVLSCVSGVWTAAGGSAYWGDPVNTYSALPGTDAQGTVRVTKDTGRAFQWTGVAWQAIAVDQNGNMYIPGTVTAANGRASLWDQSSEGAVLTLRDATGQQMHLEQIGGKMRWINGPWSAELASIDQAGNLNTAGNIYAKASLMTGGNTLCQGNWNTCWFGDGWNNAARMPGAFYVQNTSGSGYANTYGNDFYIAAIGKWASQLGGTNWYTAAWWSQNSTNWQYNGSGRSQLIQASSDIAPRDCSIYGAVDGWGTVAQQMTAESQWSAGCFISFMVPPGKSWNVYGGRFGGTLNILTWVYTL